jgi:uncharacterized protein (TIGR02284 family)
MQATTLKVEDALYRLEEICREGEQRYKTAADLVGDQRLKAELLRYSQQRAEFLGELTKAAGELHRTPQGPGPLAGAHGRFNIGAGDSQSTVLAECERGEEEAIEAYQQAILAGVPWPVGDLVARQLRVITSTRDRIQSLGEAARKRDKV